MENSHIQWTHHTINPWLGCTKVSPGCLNCYAETWDKRFSGGKHWGKGAPRQRTSAANWKEPLKWNRAAAEELNTFNGLHNAQYLTPPVRPRVFCASLADWLDDEVPIEWLADLLDLIRRTPFLDWQLLTKRPENWKERLDQVLESEPLTEEDDNRYVLSDWILDWYNGKPPANVWMGTSVEDQTRADLRIPLLLKIPARIRFLSCEPLLEPVTMFSDHLLHVWPEGGIKSCLHWIIVGGESGSGCRPMDISWAESIRKQCAAANVKFFMKQLGGQVLKRGDMEFFPETLRVREFPT